MMRLLRFLGVLVSVAMLTACNDAGLKLFQVATPTSVAPSLVIAPSTIRPGDIVTLSGSNWPQQARITMVINSLDRASDGNINLGDTTASDQGALSFVTLVPQSVKPGSWVVLAQVDTRADSRTGVATALLTVQVSDTLLSAVTPSPEPDLPADATSVVDTPQPESTLSPEPSPTSPAPATPPTLAAAMSNSRFALRGDGWAPNDHITISLSRSSDGSNAVRLGDVVADANGRFVFSARLSRQDRAASFAIAADAGYRVITRIAKGD